ncbi:MAG: CBS domain-containing protein, partial [Myxococcales bacterium]|nr:CBS domain-containing protein [Myxococcales bacterium]
MTADELMTPDPETLTPDDTVRDAMDLLYSLG